MSESDFFCSACGAKMDLPFYFCETCRPIVDGASDCMATLRAQLTQAQERFGEVAANLEVVVTVKRRLAEQLAQRDAEIARLREHICIDCKHAIDLIEEFPEARKGGERDA